LSIRFHGRASEPKRQALIGKRKSTQPPPTLAAAATEIEHNAADFLFGFPVRRRFTAELK